MTHRRVHRIFATLTVLVPALVLNGCTGSDSGQPPTPTAPQSSASAEVETNFEKLEDQFDARLGVYALDTGSGAELGWRDDERFAYASIVKALAAGAVLDEVGVAGLAEPVAIDAADILPHSPVTEQHVGGTMTLGEVAEAAVVHSDNAAGNHLFTALGGPAELDAALAELGDETTNVVRAEPELNEATPGDDRDTTTPRAIATSLADYVLGDVLTAEEQEVLSGWLTQPQPTEPLIGADLPAEWTVGDKSGAGLYGTRNDIAVVWPENDDPIVVAVLSSRDEQDADYDDRLIAEAAEMAVSGLA